MKKRPLILAALLALATTALFADKLPVPGPSWTHVDPSAPGWDAQKLADVQAKLRHLRPTALLILQDGKTVAEWGDITRKVNVYSVRKSVISALYGMGVAEGRIGLDRSLADIGIDDKEPKLTPEEQQATVRDLLMARSGIYHVAAYEIGGISKQRPERGSHPHGRLWYYNNFDFNALGTIYHKLVGEDVFDAVERRLAKPLGMQDFTAADGELVFDPRSEHPAYLMHFTARDLARFGLLYLNKGRLDGKQIVPEAWVAESTRQWSTSGTGLGYGYLWWQPPASMEGAEGAFFAMGKGGQAIAVIPSRHLVIVETLNMGPDETGISMGQFLELMQLILTAAPTGAS